MSASNSFDFSSRTAACSVPEMPQRSRACLAECAARAAADDQVLVAQRSSLVAMAATIISQRARRGFSSMPKPHGARRRLCDLGSICSMTVGSSTWLRIAIHLRRWSNSSR